MILLSGCFDLQHLAQRRTSPSTQVSASFSAAPNPMLCRWPSAIVIWRCSVEMFFSFTGILNFALPLAPGTFGASVFALGVHIISSQAAVALATSSACWCLLLVLKAN